MSTLSTSEMQRTASALEFAAVQVDEGQHGMARDIAGTSVDVFLSDEDRRNYLLEMLTFSGAPQISSSESRGSEWERLPGLINTGDEMGHLTEVSPYTLPAAFGTNTHLYDHPLEASVDPSIGAARARVSADTPPQPTRYSSSSLPRKRRRYLHAELATQASSQNSGVPFSGAVNGMESEIALGISSSAEDKLRASPVPRDVPHTNDVRIDVQSVSTEPGPGSSAQATRTSPRKRKSYAAVPIATLVVPLPPRKKRDRKVQDRAQIKIQDRGKSNSVGRPRKTAANTTQNGDSDTEDSDPTPRRRRTLPSEMRRTRIGVPVAALATSVDLSADTSAPQKTTQPFKNMEPVNAYSIQTTFRSSDFVHHSAPFMYSAPTTAPAHGSVMILPGQSPHLPNSFTTSAASCGLQDDKTNLPGYYGVETRNSEATTDTSSFTWINYSTTEPHPRTRVSQPPLSPPVQPQSPVELPQEPASVLSRNETTGPRPRGQQPRTPTPLELALGVGLGYGPALQKHIHSLLDNADERAAARMLLALSAAPGK